MPLTDDDVAKILGAEVGRSGLTVAQHLELTRKDARDAKAQVILLRAALDAMSQGGDVKAAVDDALAELRIVRDGTAWGVCDPERRWWVPHHSLAPYRLVELAAAEHARLVGHVEAARPWDLFKYIQLIYLGEDGFSGGRDVLTAPAGYGDQVRQDRWYMSPPAK